MTDDTGSQIDTSADASPPQARQVVQALLRAVASSTVLVAVYFLLPLDHSSRWLAIVVLVIGLALLTGLVTLQVGWVAASAYPRLRGVEALATSIPLFVLLFASAYLAMASETPGSFSERLTHTRALYFTVTVFATVGFGDITAESNFAQLVVTGQMIIDIVIIGIGAKIIVGAINRRRHHPNSNRQ